MAITLTDELEELLNNKVKSGAYRSTDEVIMASLRLLEAREKGMDELRRQILLGIEDTKEGRFTAYRTESELDALSDDIIKQGENKSDGPKER